MAVAAGTQKAKKLAVAFGAAASQAPGTMAIVMLPAPSRDTAAAAYFEKAAAALEGLYEGTAHAENTQVPAHASQLAPPKEFGTLPAADQMAI